MTDYTLYYLAIGLLAAFTMILIDIYTDDNCNFFDFRRTKLRDKLHNAMTQNRGAT